MSYPVDRPRCPYCKRFSPRVCDSCKVIVAALFPPDVDPKRKSRPRGEIGRLLPAAPLARWINQAASRHTFRGLARTLSERFGTDVNSELRQLQRISSGNVPRVQGAVADRILVGLNGPSAGGLFGGEW